MKITVLSVGRWRVFVFSFVLLFSLFSAGVHTAFATCTAGSSIANGANPVTPSTSGAVWGTGPSGPFTTDSNQGAIARFLGAALGSSATLTVTNLGCPASCTSFTGGTAYGVTASPYGSWCGMNATVSWSCPTGQSASTGGTCTANPYILTVTRSGNGSGTVTSNVGGINCGATCAVGVSGSVILTATPATNNSFGGWSGGGCSGTSPCTVAMTSAQTVNATFSITTDTVAPSIPSFTSVTAVSSSQINLSWNASSDNVAVTGYKVYRGGSLLTTLGNVTSYSDIGLAASTQYMYAVSACDAATNCSAQSGSYFLWTPAGSDTQAPSVPTGLTASATSPSQINLTWNASSDNVAVTGYDVYRGGGTPIASPTGTSYLDTGLAASTPYSYTVRAHDAAGNNSAQTSSVSATTQAATPPPSSGPVFVFTSGSSWTIPSGVTGIKVWVIGGGGGGAGSTNSDGTSGGGGGAGGVSYRTYSVSAGQTLSYAIGTGGLGGYNTGNGNAGGATSATYGGTQITGGGGGGGQYNNGTTGTGGTGDTSGGTGSGATGDTGGGGGGAIGSINGTANGCAGGTGGQSVDISGLFTALATASGYPTTSPGSGPVGGCSGNPSNGMHGTMATGFGTGGGGAGYYGGDGGVGKYGGGGGGAAGFTAFQTGGAGGGGVVVIDTAVTAGDTTAPTVPTGLTATPYSSTQINLTWTASNDAVGVTAYKVYRGATLINTLGNVTQYSDTGLTASTAYSYTVVACDAVPNCSAPSTAASATTLAMPDLTVTPNPPGTVSPTTAMVGTPVSFVLDIKNQGGASTVSGFSNVLKKANDASGSGVTFVATNVTGSLAAGAQTSGFSISYTPISGDVGTKYFQICADQDISGAGIINEGTYEGNNCGAWTRVDISSGPTVTSFTANSVTAAWLPYGGGSVTFSWGSSNATSCTLTGGGLSPTNLTPVAGGSFTVPNITSSATYTITCQ